MQKYNTIQYNTIQYNTIQYNTIQYNTIRQPSDIKRCNEKVQNLKMLFCQHCFLHSRRENVVSFFFQKLLKTHCRETNSVYATFYVNNCDVTRKSNISD